METGDGAQGKVSSPDDLFRLELRVRWLFAPLARWRFRPPQPASLVRVGKPRPAPQEPVESDRPVEVGLKAVEKFTLIKESNECCYWCDRPIGSPVTLRRGTVRLRLHWDHVIPSHAGGETSLENMVPSCHLCNGWKSGKVFDTEAAIREYLEAKWIAEFPVLDADEPSTPKPDPVAEPNVAAPEPVPSPSGKTSTPKTHAPRSDAPADPPDQIPIPRHLPVGKTVIVLKGSQFHRTGKIAGPSRTRNGWVRVFLEPQDVPWRFLPQDLALLKEKAPEQ